MIFESKLESIKRFELSLWMEGLRDKDLSPETCNRTLFLVKYMFNCSRRWGFITESLARDVAIFPEKKFLEQYLSEDEARRILEALNTDKDRQAAQAVKLPLRTGVGNLKFWRYAGRTWI